MVSKPVLLNATHDITSFDCGKEPVTEFLKRYALMNQAGGATRTYVALSGNNVVGYYSLAPYSVSHKEAPDRVTKGQSKHRIPCILLARLAVDKSQQGKGLGGSLFRDALLRADSAHSAVGGRAFLVHAVDEEALGFYAKYEMLPSPTNPFHLFLLFKDVRAILAAD